MSESLRNISYDCKVVYQAAAFYFSLQATGKYRVSTDAIVIPPYRIPVAFASACMDYTYKYIPKNRSEINSGFRRICGSDDSEVGDRVYEASRRLNSFCYVVEFTITTPTVTDFYRTRTMGINRGYGDCPTDI